MIEALAAVCFVSIGFAYAYVRAAIAHARLCEQLGRQLRLVGTLDEPTLRQHVEMIAANLLGEDRK